MNDNYGEKFITFFLENWSLLGVHCHCHWGLFSVFGSPFFSISPFSLFQVLRTREKSVQPLSNVCLTEILVFLFISQNRMISVNMSKLHFWVPIDWFRSICPNFTFRSPLHVGAVGQTPPPPPFLAMSGFWNIWFRPPLSGFGPFCILMLIDVIATCSCIYLSDYLDLRLLGPYFRPFCILMFIDVIATCSCIYLSDYPWSPTLGSLF